MSISEEIRPKIYEEWNAGLSSSQLAAKYKTTRNAILGLLHRARAAGVTLRTHENIRRAVEGKRRPKRTTPSSTPSLPKLVAQPRVVYQKPIRRKVPKQPEDKRWVPLWQTGDKTCRYIDHRNLYCNENTSHGSWCDEHHGLMTRVIK